MLRKTGLGKDAFGQTVGLKRGNIGSYIDRKAYPKIETLQKISETYKVSIDDLINTDLANNNLKPRGIVSKNAINDYSVSEIIENIYIRDDEFSSSPLLWMYIKMKILDGKIEDEELIIERLESIIEKNISKYSK
ncbi:hypothetical protein [Aquimarina hainanensis]|uniref:hypothetical protein n=1 Tax=Aquimarina hainanensis TaxID=1578017 RepID=UPI00361C725D